MTPETPPAAPRPVGLWTVPNVLSAVRLVGSPFLVVAAAAGAAEVSLGLFLVFWMTDWVDGKLAIRWKQQTAFGARLDTAADITFYAASVAAVAILRWDVIRGEAVWVGAAVGSYLVSVAAGLVRFGGVPSYHTRMAKISWFVVGVAFVALFAGWSVWVLRAAAAAVVVTNLEAAVISFVLPERRVDVPSVYHALKVRAGARLGERPRQ